MASFGFRILRRIALTMRLARSRYDDDQRSDQELHRDHSGSPDVALAWISYCRAIMRHPDFIAPVT